MERFRSRFRSKKRTGVSDSTNAQQKQQLKEQTDATKRLDRNDASNEGTKRSNAPLLNENMPIRELWKVAYEKLQEEDGTLIKNYEIKLNKSVAASLMQHLPFQTNKRDQMDAILRIKMDEINTNASSPEFKAKAGEFIQLFMKVVDSANDYISNAASANPYTSIAWTGVSLVLPLLLNPSEQREALAKGLDYITSLITQSRMREELYIECYESEKLATGGYEKFRQSHSQYKVALEKLYRQILRVQATVYCHYATTPALRLTQDSIKWHSWEQLLNELRDQDTYFTAIEERWRDMQRYEQVLATQNLHRTTINTLSAQLSVSQKALDNATREEYESLLHWLCDVDPSSLYKAARDRHETGTNEWLIKDSQEFKTWKTEPKSLLWLHGKAGAGKSILTSSVIKYLRDQHPSEASPSTALAYFYFSFSDPQKQTVDVMLASLVKQICSHGNEEFLFIRDFRQHKKRGDRPDTQTLEQMLVASASSFPNVHVVIDALDECPLLNDKRENLLKSLGRVLQNAPNSLHIFLTSRKEHDIDRELRNFLSSPSRIEINLLAHQDTLNCDIRHYIDLKLATAHFTSWPESVKEEVKQSLVDKADCMFQYVRLQFEALQKLSTTPGIRKALRDLPIGLDATYDRILQSIDSDFQAQVIGSLKWLAFSRRTLNIQELSEIFTIFTTSSDDAVFDEAQRPFSCADILKHFSGLIVTQDNKSKKSDLPKYPVRLVHFSLREYLTSKRVSEGSTSMFSFNEVDGHLSIVRSCLVYLRHLSSQYAKGVLKPFWFRTGHSDHSDQLANYVVCYWMDHLEEILDEKPEIAQESTPLLAANSQSLLTLLRINTNHLYRGRENEPLLRPYCYTASLGLRRLTKLLISKGVNKYVTQHDLRRALSIAAYIGNTDMMQLLLEAGASPDDPGTHHTSLDIALEWGHINVIELLEKHGTTINTHANNKWPFNFMDTQYITHLLDKGIDINMQDEFFGTALHTAIDGRHERIFNLLLTRGADMNAVHEDLGTPLQHACTIKEGHTTKFIKMLLERGADPNVRGGKFGTALQAACATLSTDDPRFVRRIRPARLRKIGHEQYAASMHVVRRNIQLLIDHGADVTVQGGEYGSALHALARSIEPETGELIKLLLDKGARINQLGDAEWGTALHVACIEGMMDTVCLLLDSGADVNAAGGEIGTPLQAAVTSKRSWFRVSEETNALEREKELELIQEIVELLLKRGAEINQRGGKYDSVLQAACANPFVDMKLFRLLLDHGADATAEGGHYGTTLAAACTNPRIGLEGAHLLLDRGVDVNAKGVQSGTALITACSDGQLDVVRLLIDRGADVNATGGPYGTALIAACRRAQLNMMRLLIDCGADVNAKSAKGQTALIIACSRDETNEATKSMVELLLSKGADVNAVDEDGDTPLVCACKYGGCEDLGLMELLLENGANVSHNDYAAWHGVSGRTPTLPMLELLYSYDIDINHVHPECGAVLNAIIRNWCYDDGREMDPRICWLLDHGADINIKGGEFGFPLQAACAYTPWSGSFRDINMISSKTRLLLEKCPNIDIHAQGGRFGSALQAAAFSGHTELVKLLLDKKANANAAGGFYGSALNAAISSGYWNIVEILLEAGAIPDCHIHQQPDEEWLEKIRQDEKNDDYKGEKQGSVERYMKFWEVQSMSGSGS